MRKYNLKVFPTLYEVAIPQNTGIIETKRENII